MSKLDQASLSATACADPRHLLNDEATLSQIARDAIKIAASVSGGRAAAHVHENGGLSISMAQGEVVSAERQGRQTLSVTVIDQHRRGTASTGIFSAQAIRDVVERASFIASQVEPDVDGDFADDADLAHRAPQVPLYAPSGLGAEGLTGAALAVEQAARAAIESQPDEARVLESGASTHENRWALAIGSDFMTVGSSSLHSRSAQVIAERGGRMSSSWWQTTDRRLEQMLSTRVVGETAVVRAVGKLGGRGLETRDAPILFDSTIASSLVDDLVSTISGQAQYQKASFLAGAIGLSALASHLHLLEDPSEPYGMVSGACDEEGVAGIKRAVICGGRVEGYFLSSLSARRLGMRSTGNAGGAWNLQLRSDRTTQADDLPAMLKRLGTGLWVTEFLGGQFDPVTGSYSRAVAGFWVEAGQVVHPVEDITIGGNFKDMLLAITHVGADVYRSGRTRSGSLLVEQMRISGR